MLKSITTILIVVCALSAKAQVKKPAAKPVESKASLFNKIRSKILAFGDSVRNVTYSLEDNTLTIQYADTRQIKVTEFINNLDPDATTWELFRDTQIKFRMFSSSPDLYAGKVRVVDTDAFFELQRELFKIEPRMKNVPADSINYYTYACYMVLNKNVNADNMHDFELDPNGYEINQKLPSTGIIFSLSKIGSEPNFQQSFAALYKKLIAICRKEAQASNE